MELPKESLKPGVRPRIGTMKGSSAMAYDANANIGVYNDMKDFGDRSILTWDDKNDLVETRDMYDQVIWKPTKKPVIELVFDKSKIFKGFDGSIFYRFEGRSGRYEELGVAEQQRCRALARAAPDEEGGGPARPWPRGGRPGR